MKSILNEELERMLYLTQHKRGVVVSEQELTGVGGRKKVNDNPGNWKGRDSGKINLGSVGTDELRDVSGPVQAINVPYGTEDNYNLLATSFVPRYTTKVTSSGTPPEIIPLPPLSMKDDKFPYDDNTIGPNFKKFTEASSAFEEFIKNLLNFVLKGCLDNLKSIEIKGFADSARPTLSGNDHSKYGFNKPYGDSKTDDERNLFLANNRGKNIGDLIVSRIKEDSKGNVDLTDKIKILPGVSYLGQGRSKRGGEFRRVDINPIYDKCEMNDIEKSGESKQTTEPTNENELILDLSPYGPNNIPAKEFKSRRGDVFLEISKEVCDKNNLYQILPMYGGTSLNNKQIVDGKIDNDELIVDGYSFGKIKNASEIGDYEFDSRAVYVTTGRICITNKMSDGVLVRDIKFQFREP